MPYDRYPCNRAGTHRAAGVSQLVEKVRKDFFDKLGKISKLVAQVLKFCDSDAKENPDGFLSHYLSLRNLWPKRFFDSLRWDTPHSRCVPPFSNWRNTRASSREHFADGMVGDDYAILITPSAR